MIKTKTEGWQRVPATQVLHGLHESVDPSYANLSDYSLWHNIIHGLFKQAQPDSSTFSPISSNTMVDHWFCELDGHGIYPPEDLQNIKWSTVLDTSHVVLGGDYHIVRVSRVGRYRYISISLYGCWHQSAPTEYVRFATKEA